MRLLWVKSSRLVAVLITSLMVLSSRLRSDRIPKNVLAPFSQATTETADLFYIVFWIAVVIFILVEGLLVFFVFRYQRRAQDEHPEQYHGNTRFGSYVDADSCRHFSGRFALTIRSMGTTGPRLLHPGQVSH